MAIKPNTTVNDSTAATLAAPDDWAAPVADCVTLPVAEGVDEGTEEAPDVGLADDAPLLVGTEPVLCPTGAEQLLASNPHY